MILHVDMDAYFASVEQRDFPELRGKPVLVGGTPAQRGVVAAASYEARKFGIRSAMPMSQAVRLCPHALLRPGRYEVYRAVAKQIRGIFNDFTPLVEPLSLDEAFLDVTGCEKSVGDAATIGHLIKQRIRNECGLIASVGIAPVKFVAKLASDEGKPDGFVIIPEARVLSFLEPLPVRRLWGVGKSTAAVLEQKRLRTIGDLRQLTSEQLERILGKTGVHLWELAHGIDPRPVDPQRETKSISHENTFATDVSDPQQLRLVLRELTDQVCWRLRQQGLFASTATIKIRLADFQTVTRSQSLPEPVDESAIFSKVVQTLWDKQKSWLKSPVRLLGVGLSGLTSIQETQLLLFGQEERERNHRIDQVRDQIRTRFGSASLVPGDMLNAQAGGPKEDQTSAKNETPRS